MKKSCKASIVSLFLFVIVVAEQGLKIYTGNTHEYIYKRRIVRTESLRVSELYYVKLER